MAAHKFTLRNPFQYKQPQISMKRTPLMASFCIILGLSVAAHAEPKVASVFTEHMVLQREIAVPIWGTAGSGEKVTVSFAGQTQSATADENGKWSVKLNPMSASTEPRTLTVNQTQLTDVLVGDVWLASGQSNMGFSVGSSDNAQQEIAQADFPNIRLFTVAQNPQMTPTRSVGGAWQPCSPQTIAKFSGVAYYFGRELHRELKVPIGLLHTSVGGTPAEAWTRKEALQTLPALTERVNKEITQYQSQEGDNKRFVIERAAWEEKYNVKPPAIAETAKNWMDPALNLSEWKSITLPAQWAQLGAKSGGVFWLRKEVTLPESAAGQPFSLSLNWVSEQYDTPFFNGVQIGQTHDKAPEFYNLQRRYNVPGKLVKAGPNVIAVRIVSATQYAGMWQWGHMLGLPVQNAENLKIDNHWLMNTESTFTALPSDALKSRPKPNTMAFRLVPSALYNGMISPLVPYAIKGAIWYQGENNAGKHMEYREILSLMIRDWRSQWGQGDFPFIIQQLVNNSQPQKEANNRDNWPFLREAQEQVADTVPNCGMAVGIELGDAFTIHPTNKQDVGKRMALGALGKFYGKNCEFSGPRYASMQVEGAAIRVKFTHADGLQAKGGTLQRFAIAGEDQNFVWADARCDGNTVVVSSPSVPKPKAVRYAWADNPEGCNLYNAAGLPACPFRTDTYSQNIQKGKISP